MTASEALPRLGCIHKVPDLAITTFESGVLVPLAISRSRKDYSYPLEEPHFSIAFTYSWPETTSPNTVCLPFRCGVGTVVMKNCEPLLDGASAHDNSLSNGSWPTYLVQSLPCWTKTPLSAITALSVWIKRRRTRVDKACHASWRSSRH